MFFFWYTGENTKNKCSSNNPNILNYSAKQLLDTLGLCYRPGIIYDLSECTPNLPLIRQSKPNSQSKTKLVYEQFYKKKLHYLCCFLMMEALKTSFISNTSLFVCIPILVIERIYKNK